MHFRLIMLAIMLAISGCATSGQDQESTSDLEPASATDPVQKAGDQPVSGESGSLPREEPILETVPSPVRKPFPPSSFADGGIDSKALLGQEMSAVELLLGPPFTKREEAPARTWVYTHETCDLTISFYPDLHDLKYKVLSVQGTRKTPIYDEGDNVTKRCLTHIRNQYTRFQHSADQ